MVQALITIGLFLAAFGLAGIACWFGERRLAKRDPNWLEEGGRPRW